MKKQKKKSKTKRIGAQKKKDLDIISKAMECADKDKTAREKPITEDEFLKKYK